MSVFNRSRLLAGLCCLVGALAVSAEAASKAQTAAVPVKPGTKAPEAAATPPVQPPGRAVQGRLHNGLRYVILRRRIDHPGVGLTMQVGGGFIAERRPGERGLAHLIEHLAFHSPTRSAPDDLRRFRTVGMPLTLPEPAGGNTIWRESDYYVVSRTPSAVDLDSLLGLYREVASELLFRPKAVEEQRAEVIREMAGRRQGNIFNARYIAAVAPGSPVDVIDGQNSEDVATASLQTIQALYRRLYRPENTTLAIVGDVDPTSVEALIRQRFGDWRGAGPVPRRTAIPTFRPDRIAPISVDALPNGRTTAMITVTGPTPPPAPTRDQQMEAVLMDMLATRATNHRLATTQPAGPPGKYGIFIENGEYGHRLIMLWDNFASGRWQPAVAGLSRTACELSATGWTDAEWSGAKQHVLEELERRATEMPNLDVAGQLADAIAAGREPISPGELLQHARAWFPAVSVRSANGWWFRQWRAGVQHLRVEGPEFAQMRDSQSAVRAAADSAVRPATCRVRRS